MAKGRDLFHGVKPVEGHVENKLENLSCYADNEGLISLVQLYMKAALKKNPKLQLLSCSIGF